MPPVTRHPRICGLMSNAEAALSCADKVNFGCAVEIFDATEMTTVSASHMTGSDRSPGIPDRVSLNSNELGRRRDSRRTR